MHERVRAFGGLVQYNPTFKLSPYCNIIMINFSEKEKEFQNSKQHVHKKMNPFTI
jgi:hypothetical protein